MLQRIRIVPVPKFRLYGALVKKEFAHYQANRGTFYRSGSKVKDRTKWGHKTYPGWINTQRSLGETVVVEVRTKSPSSDWQLLQAFIGFLSRHFGDKIDAVNVQFPK